MRRRLIEALKEEGIEDERVLKAFDDVPRHYFLDNAFAEQAYSNMAFQIGKGQTISHPYTVAFQTQLLEIKRGDKILEIGSGSGFQTCILCKMGAKVFSIERHKELHIKAKMMIRHFGMSARMIFGDGYKGLPIFAPFDKIIVTCGAPNIPVELFQQLKVGGILVIPVGGANGQVMKKIIKISEQEFDEAEFGDFSFVPMLENRE